MEYKVFKDKVILQGDDKEVLAEVTFPEKGSVRVIDHTFVDEKLRGQGIAAKLMELAAREIRAQGKKAKAECAYAVKWFSANESEKDLLD